MFVVIVFIVVIIIIVVFATISERKRIKKASNVWYSIAKKMKLKFTASSLSSVGLINGKLNHHLIKVDTFVRSSGKSSQLYTRFRINFSKPVKTDFTLTKQTFFQSLGNVFGVQDIKVGDRAFDDSIVVKGHNASRIISFLTPARRSQIKLAVSQFSEITITNRYAEGIKPGLVSESVMLQGHIKMFEKLADVLSHRHSDAHPITKARKARKHGKLDKAVEIIQKAKLNKKDDILEAKELEGEMLYISGRKSDAHKVFKEAAAELPEDHHIKQWKKMADENTKDDSIFEEAKVEPVIQEVLELQEKDDTVICNGLAMEEVFDELFYRNLGTFDSTALFEKKYAGSKIEWKGKLISVQEFSFDFVFKNSTGVKSVFESTEVKQIASSVKIKIIAHFPEGALDEMKKLKGEELTFSGNLLSIDALMKNIYIENANLN